MSVRPGISLEEWYPLVEKLVPTPRTVIIRAEADMAPLLYAGDPDAPVIESEARKLYGDIARAAAVVGTPFFLRTGLMSGKHAWEETCFVRSADLELIAKHVYNIVEFSELADVFGGRPTSIWVVRELLPTKAAFTAFEGKMPITREQRFFFNDGRYVGHHPYWPPEAIAGDDESNIPELRDRHRADTDNWRERLDELNTITRADVALLTKQTLQLAQVIPGAWSVDWLWVEDEGWYLTDMAWAEQSYVWWEHPTAPEEGAW